MRRLARDLRSENIIYILFLAEMPASIRSLVTVWEETDLDKIAKIDKMVKAITTNASFAIDASPTLASPADSVGIYAATSAFQQLGYAHARCQGIKKECQAHPITFPITQYISWL